MTVRCDGVDRDRLNICRYHCGYARSTLNGRDLVRAVTQPGRAVARDDHRRPRDGCLADLRAVGINDNLRGVGRRRHRSSQETSNRGAVNGELLLRFVEPAAELVN